jgi:hypothetical protein
MSELSLEQQALIRALRERGPSSPARWLPDDHPAHEERRAVWVC